MLPRQKATNWVGPGRGRTSTRPGANGVVELTPFEFLDRLADLVPPPQKHRHRYHGVFAPNQKPRSHDPVIVADVPLAGLSFHSLNSSAYPRPCTGRGRYTASRMQQPDL